MATFKNSDEMVAIFSAFFERIAAQEEIGRELAKSQLIIRFKVHDPDGMITIDCRHTPAESGKPFSTFFGESSLEPDIVFTNSADFLHEFWQGKVNIVTALLSGQTKAEGNLGQAVKMMPAIQPLFRLYPQVLRELGREDLIIL